MIGEALTWAVENPQAGWVVPLLYLVWEIRGPRGRVNQLIGLIKNLVTVVRALARSADDVDEEAVDEYLVENGLEPGDLLNDPGDDQDQDRERRDGDHHDRRVRSD